MPPPVVKIALEGVITLLKASVDDPVTCLMAHPLSGIVAMGSAAGSVRMAFPKFDQEHAQSSEAGGGTESNGEGGGDLEEGKNNGESPSGESKKGVIEQIKFTISANPDSTTSLLPISMVVLCRRAEEAIRSIYINDEDDSLYAVSGDVSVLRWDLRNLESDVPFIKGAKHTRIQVNIFHAYNSCPRTAVAQSGRTIVWLTEGNPKSHLMVLPENYRTPNPNINFDTMMEPLPVNRDDQDVITQDSLQRKVSFPWQIDSIAYSFRNNRLCWLWSDREMGGWTINVYDWNQRKDLRTIPIKKGDSKGLHPWGVSCVENDVIGIISGKIVNLWDCTSGALVQSFSDWHSSDIVSIYLDRVNQGETYQLLILTISQDGRIVRWMSNPIAGLAYASSIGGKKTVYQLPKERAQFVLGVPVSCSGHFSEQGMISTQKGNLIVFYTTIFSAGSSQSLDWICL